MGVSIDALAGAILGDQAAAAGLTVHDRPDEHRGPGGRRRRLREIENAIGDSCRPRHLARTLEAARAAILELPDGDNRRAGVALIALRELAGLRIEVAALEEHLASLRSIGVLPQDTHEPVRASERVEPAERPPPALQLVQTLTIAPGAPAAQPTTKSCRRTASAVLVRERAAA